MISIDKSNFLSIEQLQETYLKQQSNKNTKSNEQVRFDEILQKQQSSRNEKVQNSKFSAELKFSKHAANRLSDRSIELTHEQLERLNVGTKRAGEKGIKDSLVILDELAFIVNTKNNTVITAMEQTETSENIFTNIDGAIIV